METKKFFILFKEQEDKLDNKESSNTPKTVSEIREDINMYILWCLRYIEFKEYFTTMNSQIEGEINLDAALISGRIFLNNKAFSYLSKLDLDRKKHIKTIKLIKDLHFIHCLNFSLATFEQQEEYISCALLRDIKNIYLDEENNLD